jgi:hypothetical protein
VIGGAPSMTDDALGEADPVQQAAQRDILERTLRAALAHLPASKAAAIAAAASGIEREVAYARAVQLSAERR